MMTDVLLQPLSALFTELGDRFGGFRCFDTSVKGFAPHVEAAAVLISVLWAVQFCETMPISADGTVHFHLDCMFAGMTAKGQWFAKAHEQMQHTTRALVHWLEARHAIRPQWLHVPAQSCPYWPPLE
jgi:hypothetical protein